MFVHRLKSTVPKPQKSDNSLSLPKPFGIMFYLFRENIGKKRIRALPFLLISYTIIFLMCEAQVRFLFLSIFFYFLV